MAKSKRKTTTAGRLSATVQRDAFVGALRGTMALGCDSGRDYVRLSVEDGFLVLRAWSRTHDTWGEWRLVVTRQEGGRWRPTYVALNNNLYATISNDMPGDALWLVRSEGALRLTAGERSLVIITHDDVGQPEAPEITQRDATFALDAEIMHNALSRGGFMHGKDWQYYLGGALLRFESTEFDVCSTDGALLVFAAMPPAGLPEGPRIDMLVESAAVAALVEAIDKPGLVTVTASADWIEFCWPSCRVVTRRQRGAFPEFKKIAGQTGPLRVEFDSRELLSALAFVSAGTRVAVQFDVEPGHCALSSESEVYGDRKALLGVAYKGPTIRAMYDSNLLVRLIESMHPCRVAWTTRGNEHQEGAPDGVRSATQFRPVGRDDHTCVLMPMRL